MSDTLLSISQAAKKLGVAAVTLRLWERQGKIKSLRTGGNQRRYSSAMLDEFIGRKTQAPTIQVSPPLVPPLESRGGYPKGEGDSNFHHQILSMPLIAPIQKQVLAWTLAVITLAGGGAGIYKYSGGNGEGVNKILGWFKNRGIPEQLAMSNEHSDGSVLAAETVNDDYRFVVNVPALFNKNITAPNIIYGLTAGTNVTITGGQNPTINATDQTTDLKIFKTVKVGSTEISAGSKTDTLELVAGSNVTLSTSDKKITIAASSTDITTSGWTDDGTIVRLTTAGNLVSLGAASGAARLNLNVDNDTDLLTASKSGNLKFKLNSNGVITSGTWQGTVVANAYLANSAVTVTAGTGLSGGGTVSLGDSITLSLATVPTTLGGTGITTYTTGDILYSSATNTLSKLAVGTAGQVLTVTGGVPVWAGGLGGTGTVGYWQRSAGGVLAPDSIIDDLAIGGTSTASALFKVSGTTGNIITSGTFTLPSSNTLTGQAGNIQLSGGVSVGGGTTYYVNTSGNANFNTLNAATTTLGGTTVTSLLNSGSASVSGGLILYGVTTVSTTGMQTLNLGDSSTGNIVIPNKLIAQGDVSLSAGVIDNAELAGSIAASKLVGTDIATVGTITSGTWTGSVIGPAYGGTGVANNAASTLTISGNYATTLTVSGTTGVTLPTTGTLATLAGSETLTNKTLTTPIIAQISNTGTLTLPTSTDTLVGRATTDTLTNKTWNGVAIGPTYGGTNQTTWTTGDILYASGTNTLAKLGVGSDTQVLTVSGGVPTWTSNASIGNWQRNSGTVSPLNITDDVLVGGISTAAATLRISSAGVVTLPNSNTLTGVSGYLQLANGISVGGGTTYYINNLGTANLNGLTAGTTSLGGTTVTSLTDTGSASVSGALTLYTTPTIATTSKQTLTLGDSNTGNVVVTNNLSAANLSGTNTGDQTITLTGDVTGSGTGSFATTIGALKVTNAMLAGSIAPSKLLTVTEGYGGTNQTTYTTGDILYASGTNTLAKLGIGGANQVLSVVAGVPGWVESGAVGTNYWNISSGALFPLSSTADLLVGGQSTASAKFAFINVGSGTPTASVSGNLVLDAAGVISTTKKQTLTIGDSSTGNIAFGQTITSGTWNGTAIGATYGGTGQTTWTTGDLPYASATNTVSKLTVGSTNQVLIVSGGVPTWGSVPGSSCVDCILNDPGGTQTITPTVSTGTGLRVAQASGGTVDVFSVTNNGSTTKYFAIDSSGNATASGNLTFDSAVALQTTKNQTLTIGGNTTGNISLANAVTTSSTINSQTISSSANLTGTLTLAGILTANSSATISGNLALFGTPTIVTANKQSLTLGDSNTGNIAIANAAVLSSTLTLPNSNTFTGVSGYAQASAGISVGGGTTYYINNLGTANLNGLTAGTTSLGGTTVTSLTDTGSASVSGALTLYTTPTIATTAKQTLTLGDSNTGNVVVTNNLSAANLSGSNTGDQTITLTGNVTGSGTGSFATTIASQTSSVWVEKVSDETGSGLWVFATSPTLTTPVLGVASATSINKVTLTTPATGSTLTIADGKTLTSSNTLTLAGTDSTTITFQGTDTYVGRATTDTLTNKTWNGVAIGATYGGTNQTTWTTGDILYASGTNTLAKLGIGSTSQVLTVSGGVPSWGAGASSSNWQRNAGAIAPLNITDDLLVGGISTASAKFTVVSSSGNTGISGTLTLPNTNVLTGVSGYLQAGAGISVGGGTTYYINNLGTANLNAATVNSTLGVTGATTLTGALTANSTASISGSMTLFGTPTIATTAKQTLTLGDSNTGNIAIPGLTASRAIFTDASSNLTTTALSSVLLNSLSDETGTGVAVFATTPTLVTPVLGVATATSINKVTLTTPATSATLTVPDGSTVTFQGTDTYVGRATTDTLTNKTLTAPKFADLGYIADANGNELIILDTVASAVNEFTLANAATGNGVTLAATGGDTNIALSIDAKAAGALNLNNTATGDILIGGGSGSTGCTITNSTGALVCAGTINGATISSGAWNGSVIGPAYGGTGVANNIASTLTISGNYATTLTVSGTTSVTLPTSGTLATLAGTETFTNKTLTSPIVTTGLTTGSTTFTLVNTTATTVNFAGAATALNLGAATGVTTINNAASVSGALTLFGTPTIASTALQTLTLGGTTTGNIQLSPGSATPTVVVTTGGQVGIGTTGPDAKLSIVGSTATGEVKLLLANTDTSGYSVIRMGQDSTGNSQAWLHRFGSTWSSSGMWDASSVGFYESVGNMNLGAAGIFKVFTGGNAASNERLRVDATGNVGIGTTGPGEVLQVVPSAGYGAIELRANQATDKTVTLYADNGTQILAFGNQTDFAIGSSSLTQSLGVGGFSEKMRITTAGNVGIGTTSPLAKLHVEGNCVTGDTLLPIRRRRRKDKKGDKDNQDDWEDMFCRIDQIMPDDQVLSLDEATQELVYARINKKMDMGIQDIFELTTKSGRKIRVTGNHPFLVQKV